MQIRLAVSAVAVLLFFACFNQPRANSALPTYSVNRCLPQVPTWKPKGSQSGELMWFNAVEVTPEGAMWNGNHANNQELTELLARASRNRFGGMVLIIAPSLTCDQVDGLRRTITEKMKCGPERVCVEYSSMEWQATLPPPLPSDGD